MAKKSSAIRPRCLIVERHVWETGGRQQQLQFVLKPAREFFGPDTRSRSIRVRFFVPATAATAIVERDIEISREYSNGTRRTNRFPEMSAVPASFVFFQETDQPDTFDVWWQEDTAVVAAKYSGWAQGRNSQYGRGRLSVIVKAPVPRLLDRID